MSSASSMTRPQLRLLHRQPHRQPAKIVARGGLVPHGVLEQTVNQRAPGHPGVGSVARRVGDNDARRIVGSLSTDRAIFAMWRASAVTEVADHDGTRARSWAASRIADACVFAAADKSAGCAAGALTFAGTGSSGTPLRKGANASHARTPPPPLFAHRPTTSRSRARVAET